jgi:hypothetical protein
MAAATVRPVKRPQALGGRALLQQQFTLIVEDQQRESAVQNTCAPVARGLVQKADLTIGFIHQDEQFGIGCDFARGVVRVAMLVRHNLPADHNRLVRNCHRQLGPSLARGRTRFEEHPRHIGEISYNTLIIKEF